ncbi:APC family permease [Streptomyces triculaminicus]|uniref:APC family permease n=2 Tax=Streptomyces TaxID=1883 RepID=A0A939JR81_9ACTN|nr:MULTISPECIES: APC family permease [Streptomyces]MBO0653339.1 APC family permease [Streptomyces triculaminicus]QSY48209.1 APC family permease [Streptomyces griseocarneus]
MPTGTTSEISTFKGRARRLRADRIGVAGLLLSVVAASAPLMVTAGVMPTTYGTMGIVGQPLLYVALGAVLTLFSVGYAEMSRHVHNAGAFYAYIARGLGGTAGAAASVVALVSYSTMQVGIYGIFGHELATLLDDHLGVNVAWWVPALAAVAVTGALGWLKTDLNVKILGVLLLVECAMVAVFDVAAFAGPGADGLSFHAFDPATLSGAGLGTALCLTIASFVGFEQAAVYAEETSRPQVVVARVTFLAVGFIALFFAVGSWALSVAAGPSRIVEASRDAGPGLLFVLAEDRLGAGFTDVMHLFYVTGTFAALLSFHNVVARYAFAMGREGLLPAAVSRTARTSGAPAHGSLLQSVVSLLVVTVFAVTDDRPHGDPTTPVIRLFTWTGNVGALGVVLLMAATSAAVIAFFVRRGAARAQAPRLLASAVAGLALVVITGYAVADFGALLGTGPRSALRWLPPGVIGLAAVAGGVLGLVLKAVRPEAHARIGLGNEAFQLERAAEAATETATSRTGAP